MLQQASRMILPLTAPSSENDGQQPEQMNLMSIDSQATGSNMDNDWRQKLWIEVKRDTKGRDLFKSHKESSKELEDDHQFEELTEDVEELTLDKKKATEEFLSHLLQAIDGGQVQLTRLEVVKVLITGPKAQLLAQILSNHRCQVMDLELVKCRAKSDKMGLIFGALVLNKSVKNLDLTGTSIAKDSLAEFVNLLSQSRSLKMLTLFNAGLSDSAILTLAPGFKNNKGLIYLDMRQNTFENEGFKQFTASITGLKNLQTLRINGMLMGEQEIKTLRQLFSHPDCHIENLEMEELDVQEGMSAGVIDAVSTLKRLLTFDFSNNRLQPQMNASIVQMIRKYPELQILCLDHGGMTDAMCRTYFEDMQSTKLQFLNVSWNQITSESFEHLVTVLNQNQDLERLMMQHNKLEDADLTEFAKAVEKHRSLKYLDVSANKIGNVEFSKLFDAVTKSQISTFHCRKNKIGGNKVDHVLFSKSTNLKLLDLTENRLSANNGKILLKYTKLNATIESLSIEQNPHISAQLIKDIDDECRQNILIKKSILQYLPLDQSPEPKYIVSELAIHGQKLSYVDFIQKFILWNTECKTLKLSNLDMSRVQDDIKHVFEPRRLKFNNIQIFHFEDSSISQGSLSRILRSLRKMNQLRKLYLIDLSELENIMDVLSDSISKLKHLHVLDVTNTKLRTRDVSALVPLITSNRTLQEVNVLDSIISKKNMLHLWMALHYNVTVCTLRYSRINFYAITEICAVDAELQLNNIIRDQVKPKVDLHMQRNQKALGSQSVVSLRGFEFSQQTNPAVIKYIKSQKDVMRSLDLSSSNLRTADLTYFIKEISDPTAGIHLQTLNLSENPTVNDEVIKYVCLLFKTSPTLQHLNLDQTSISKQGLINILEAIRDLKHLRTISVKDNNLQLMYHKDGKDVVDRLKENFSLIELSYQHNFFDAEFAEELKKELAINQKIVDVILPQLYEQEDQAQKKRQNHEKLRKIEKKIEKRIKRKKQKALTFTKQNSLLEKPIQVKVPLRRIKTFSMYGGDDNQLIMKDSKRKDEDTMTLDSSTHFSLAKSKTLRHNPQNDIDRYFNETQHSEKDQANLYNDMNMGRPRRNSFDDHIDRDSDSSSDSDSSDSSSSSAESLKEEMEKEKKIEGGFKLSLARANLKILGIEFIGKFSKLFHNINQIDFGKDVNQDQVSQVGQQLQINKYIKKVCLNKKSVSKKQTQFIEQEIEKQKNLYEQNKKALLEQNPSQIGQSMVNLDSLQPILKHEFTNLQELDLSNSDIRSSSAVKQLCKVIDNNETIQKLVLQYCNINAKTLTIIADTLTRDGKSHLLILDIRNNPIQDPQYKVLYGLLMNNESILRIYYTLLEEENLEMLKGFYQAHAEGHDSQSASQIMLHHQHEHHHHPTPLWQKICFPIWCWKALIHDKHEAFRFKYDTYSIRKVETIMMPGVKQQLYWWSLIYYFIVFAAPYLFLEHSCEHTDKTFSFWLFVLYAAYVVFCAIWEIVVVLRIQKLLEKPSLLQFNKWHFVELFMGIIARTDTFLDICFVHLIMQCWSEYIHWAIPSLTFAILNLVFPFIMLLYLLLKPVKKGSVLYQPYLEDTCFAAFIRENMLLATVIDSFCINNSFYFFGKPLVFGKLMGFISFFTQDFPQLTIHVLFKIIIVSEAQKKLKTQSLLLVGMVFSGLAILISIFNMVMCAQNEFDPIILETEMLRRGEKLKEIEEQKRKQTIEKQMNEFKVGFRMQCQELGIKDKRRTSQKSGTSLALMIRGKSCDNLLQQTPAQSQKNSLLIVDDNHDSEYRRAQSTIMERYRKSYLDEQKGADATNEASQMAGYLDYMGQSADPTRPMSKDGTTKPSPQKLAEINEVAEKLAQYGRGSDAPLSVNLKNKGQPNVSPLKINATQNDFTSGPENQDIIKTDRDDFNSDRHHLLLGHQQRKSSQLAKKVVPVEQNDDFRATSRENSDQNLEGRNGMEQPLDESNKFIEDVSHKKELKKKFNN